MLPNHPEQIAAGDAVQASALLTGDLGVIVVRALLENGIGTIVSSWTDRPTPIDAAIDDARERQLSPRGVVLRRLRSLSALEPLITTPTGGVTGQPPRSAVIFAGRRGLRPALEQFLTARTAGAVVGFTFDEDAARIEDSIVIDPEPTAVGIVRAIDAAYVASCELGRPALVLLRERALGMRGTIRTRPACTPQQAAEADAARRADRAAAPVQLESVVERAGLIAALQGMHSGAACERVVLVAAPLRATVERALAQVSAELQPSTLAAEVDGIAIVCSTALGIVPDPQGAAGRLLAGAHSLLVIGPRAARIAERIDAAGIAPQLRSSVHAMDPSTVRGEQLAEALVNWLRDEPDLATETAIEQLDAAARRLQPRPERGMTQRVPRRGEVLNRGVSPILAAGLALAQGVIGVPSRIDAAHPTYMADTGVPLTIVPAAIFALHGPASAAPGAVNGVFLVTDVTSGVSEAAGAAGASIEYVDGGSPRAIGVAIATACRAARVTPHVIVVSEVQRVAAPRRASLGMDPDLVGTERIAMSVLPHAATALVDMGDELLVGPTSVARDCAEAHAVLDPLRELSPATFDVVRGPAATGRAARSRWNLHRRALRSATGVDL